MNIKKKILILVIICLIILIGAFIADRFLAKSYLVEIKYDDVIEKLDNKESFVLLISQTTCNHCNTYKPKLKSVAKKHECFIYYIDVDLLDEDKYEDLNKRISFKTSGTPLTIFFKNGEETTVANRIVGAESKEVVENKLKSNGFIK